MLCPCGSTKELSQCCEPFIAGRAWPETAEQLMRSRYTAYTQGNIDYIKKTSSSSALRDFDEKAAKKWAAASDWHGLKILSTEQGGAGDKKGVVEFLASYTQDGETLDHHETSTFKRNAQGRWLFEDGDSHVHKAGEGHDHHHEPIKTFVREAPKVGRNDPCPCGSGKKYKKCCG